MSHHHCIYGISWSKLHSDVKHSSKNCRWTVLKCMNLWCFPWADQICGLLSSRFSWAQSMKNWIKRLTFHSHFIRATEHRPHHQIKTSEGPEMSYVKLPSCCGPCWVQQGYSGDGGARTSQNKCYSGFLHISKLYKILVKLFMSTCTHS